MAAIMAFLAERPSHAGYAGLAAGYGGAACYGYGATGAPPGYAYAATDATSSTGTPLGTCMRGVPLVEYCDAWGCYSDYPGYATSYVYHEGGLAFSSQAFHMIGVPAGGSYVYDSECTASWGGGTSPCP